MKNSKNKKWSNENIFVILSITLILFIFLTLIFPKLESIMYYNITENIYHNKAQSGNFKNVDFVKKHENNKNTTELTYNSEKYNCKLIANELIQKYYNKMDYLIIGKQNINITNKNVAEEQINKYCSQNSINPTVQASLRQ